MTDPDRPVTRRELREEFEYFFARNLEVFATKEDLKLGLKEQRGHFDAVAESFKSEFFDKLHDWVHGNTDRLAKRVETIEDGHGRRLLDLETRVTAVELGHPRKSGE